MTHGVTARPDGRTKTCHKLLRPGAKGSVHCFHGPVGNPQGYPAPTGMCQGQGMMFWVIEQHRLAVRKPEHERQIRGVRGQAVGGWHGTTCVFVGDQSNLVAVNLLRRDYTTGIQTQVGINASMILGDRGLIVANAAAGVERSKGALAGAPLARKHAVSNPFGGDMLKSVGYNSVFFVA